MLPAAGQAAAPACLESLLRSLGWQLSEAAVPQLQVEAGRPCDRATRAEAQAAGDLRAVLSAGVDADQRRAQLQALLDHPATTCAYAFDLGDATRRAVDRLVDNPGYRFTGLQSGWIGFGAGGPARDGWQPRVSFGRRLEPVDAPSRAVQAFYTGSVRSECGVGRQIAQYATQAELYGMAGFDAEFAPEEIVIGTFVQLQQSGSILLGRNAGRFAPDGLARKASAAGRQAFMGQPGFVTHSHPRDRLDDINNQAQNFVVYDVDAAAAESLRRRGGFDYFNRRNERVWELSRQVSRDHINKPFQRLLLDDDARAWRQLNDDDVAIVREIRHLLDDPYYHGFRIYVHDRDARPVRYHLVRMLDINPRTPFEVQLSLSNLHTTLMQRWFAHRLRACAAAPEA
ncbi:hypothetical protein [Arenimonas sp. MALMAid1274]|uniref:hypothetical protein n=1 Tax=Arenimonas sp. MALMAid1274 TaxID=3411630 RepID=UPI003B9FCE38